MEAYCDFDHASCSITRKPVSGYFILFGGTPLSWKSKNQIIASFSYDEAEYRSMRRVCSKLAWLSRVLEDLQVKNLTPIPLKSDNLATVYIAKNHVFHEKTKHFELNCHYVRQKRQDGLIMLSHVTTSN